jgi:hypothetical protein
MEYVFDYDLKEDDIQKAENSSKVLGLIYYLYYISPFGAVFSSEKHVLCKKLTADVWNEKLIL